MAMIDGVLTVIKDVALGTRTRSRVLVYCTDKCLPTHCVIYGINDLGSLLEVIQGR